jgi:hypothetical protein
MGKVSEHPLQRKMPEIISPSAVVSAVEQHKSLLHFGQAIISSSSLLITYGSAAQFFSNLLPAYIG